MYDGEVICYGGDFGLLFFYRSGRPVWFPTLLKKKSGPKKFELQSF
jgi:hypothetical protein